MQKSHLLTSDGALCSTGVGYMKSILDKRQHERDQSTGGIVGALGALADIVKHAGSFFFH